MMDQRGKKNRNRHDLGGEHSSRDQVGMLHQRSGRAGNGLVEQHPRQVAAEYEHPVALGDTAGWKFHPKTNLEYENPAQKHHQRMHDSPEPSGGGADIPHFEVAPDELSY